MTKVMETLTLHKLQSFRYKYAGKIMSRANTVKMFTNISNKVTFCREERVEFRITEKTFSYTLELQT